MTMKLILSCSVFKVFLFAFIVVLPAIQATTVIPKTAFNSVADFEKYFDYLYPWGSDHNGSEHKQFQVDISGAPSIILTPYQVVAW